MQSLSEDRALGAPTDREAEGSPSPSHSGRPRVIVVAEVRLYREGLAQSLVRGGAFEVPGSATGREAALALVREHRPGLVLLDMGMPDAAAAARDIRCASPETRVVGLAVSESAEGVLACAEAGLAGYVASTASMDELVDALHRAERGELVCPAVIASSLFRHIGAIAAGEAPAGRSAEAQLTPRESEIVALIDQGLSNKEISRRLRIGLSTVKNHVHHVLEKLNVSRRGAAAARVRSHSSARD